MKYSFNSLQIIAMTTVLLSVIWAQQARAFDSGSDGSDGALDFSWVLELPAAERTIIFDPSESSTFDRDNTNRKLDTDNDNVFHFTTINIPTGVTIKLKSSKLNWMPVYWLATGDITIGGILDLNGENGHGVTSAGNGRYSSEPGPGGFSGGLGASVTNPAQNGFGPGAGNVASIDGTGGSAGHVSLGRAGNGVAGDIYGSEFLLPIIGGSGGAGSGNGVDAQATTRGGGGAGGGAIVLASNTKVTNNGRIVARGGDGFRLGCCNSSGYGSGGSVRILTPKFIGRYTGCCSYLGYIDVRGGDNVNGNGRIRIESTNNEYTGLYYPDNGASVRVSALVDSTPFLPSDTRIPKWPSVYVVSINAIDLPAEPTASFAIPDSTIDTNAAVPVVFKTNHIPTDATINLKIVSSDFGVIDVAPSFDSGDQANATWLANVAFPAGFSRGYVQAVWTP